MDKKRKQQLVVVGLILATAVLGILALVIANQLSQQQAPEDTSAAENECDPNAYETQYADSCGTGGCLTSQRLRTRCINGSYEYTCNDDSTCPCVNLNQDCSNMPCCTGQGSCKTVVGGSGSRCTADTATCTLGATQCQSGNTGYRCNCVASASGNVWNCSTADATCSTTGGGGEAGGGEAGGGTVTTTTLANCGSPCISDSDCKPAATAGVSVGCRQGTCQNLDCIGNTIAGANCACGNLNACGYSCGASVGLCQSGSSCGFIVDQCTTYEGNTNYQFCLPNTPQNSYSLKSCSDGFATNVLVKPNGTTIGLTQQDVFTACNATIAAGSTVAGTALPSTGIVDENLPLFIGLILLGLGFNLSRSRKKLASNSA